MLITGVWLFALLALRCSIIAGKVSDESDSTSCLQVQSKLQERGRTEIAREGLGESAGHIDYTSVVAEAIMLAILGGVSVGCYPAIVKCKPVREANVHPLIFQCYKSSVAFFASFLFLIPIVLRGHRLQLSWWGVATASAWIPSAVCFIASVQLVGAAFSTIVFMATSSIFAYFFSVSLLGERVKTYETIDGGTYALAPGMLAAVILGVMGLSFTSLSQGVCGKLLAETSDQNDSHDSNCTYGGEPSSFANAGKLLIGFMIAVISGGCGAAQNLIMLAGRRSTMIAHKCSLDISDCPASVVEEFDVFGSWALSVGLGSGMMMIVYFSLYAAIQKLQGNTLPSFHFPLLKTYGTFAGILAFIGTLFMQAGISMAGNAVITPLFLSVVSTTSGLWGVFYFKEISGMFRICFWLFAALWTISFAIALTLQKA